MTIGERIKNLREKKNLTQIELANLVGTTKQNIYKYENGIITNIPSDKIELISHYLDVSPCYIMGWTEEQKQSTPIVDDRSAIVEKINSLSGSQLDKLEGYLDALTEE